MFPARTLQYSGFSFLLVITPPPLPSLQPQALQAHIPQHHPHTCETSRLPCPHNSPFLSPPSQLLNSYSSLHKAVTLVLSPTTPTYLHSHPPTWIMSTSLSYMSSRYGNYILHKQILSHPSPIARTTHLQHEYILVIHELSGVLVLVVDYLVDHRETIPLPHARHHLDCHH